MGYVLPSSALFTVASFPFLLYWPHWNYLLREECCRQQLTFERDYAPFNAAHFAGTGD